MPKSSSAKLEIPDRRPDLLRCEWASGPWLRPYHDQEWGVPVHADRGHFELLTLEGAQAGLSWLTVLKRRKDYRHAFAEFDPAVVARFDRQRVGALLADQNLVRNRQKIESAVTNAAAMLEVQASFGSFDAFIWAFVDGEPVVNHWTSADQVPSQTQLSAAVCAELRRRGFRFVGPTTSYAYLQSAGLVVDHLVDCFRYAELTAETRRK
jgi:DNA-3-methyladenine glycosylase I